jgi:hypothetical protein
MGDSQATANESTPVLLKRPLKIHTLPEWSFLPTNRVHSYIGLFTGKQIVPQLAHVADLLGSPTSAAFPPTLDILITPV